MNPDHKATGGGWLPHQGVSSSTLPKRGRPSSDVYNISDNSDYFWSKRPRLDPADASRAFASGSNDIQNWQEWNQAPQMFQQAQNFTIQGDLTFNDFQGHADTMYPTMQLSLSRTTTDRQYQQNYVPSHSLGYPNSGQVCNFPQALKSVEEWQAGPAYSSLAGAVGDAQYQHSNIPVNLPASHHTRSNDSCQPFDQAVNVNSVYQPGASSNSGVFEAVHPNSGPSTHSFQGANNLEFSGTTTFINAHTIVVPNVSTRDIAVVAEALSKINFRNFLADHLRKRVGKTGRWVLSEPKFCKWRKGPRRILWGTGIPGAGKTILASIIIEYLMTLAKTNKRICVAFAFSRYTDPLTVEEILAGLLRQILEDHPQTIAYIQPLHDYHSLRKTRPSKQDLIGVLQAVFTSNLFDEKFCSLDGLDEAKSITQFELLDTLSQLPVNLLVTSRPLHLLEGKFLMADRFNILVQDSDIEHLIEEKVRQMPSLEGLLAQDEFKKWVVKTIIEKSSGMFLAASLQLDMLSVCVNIHGLRKAVETLPNGVEAMYQATMLRIEGHEQATTAKSALTWLVHARESLKMDDLRYAIAVDPETFEFDSDLLIDGPTLLSLCCGLITFERKSKLVRLVHYTAKDFLEPYLKREDPDPHAMMASTCAARLSHFNLQEVEDEDNYLDIIKKNPFFLPHSFRQWAEYSHLSIAVPAQTRELILRCSRFPIRDKHKISVCLGSSVHIAAAFNFHTLLEEWFQPSLQAFDESRLPSPSPPDFDVNAASSTLSTPLALAVHFGHVETVRVLLNVEGIDVTRGDSDGWTPLIHAAENGHLEIVEMLLAVVDTNHASARDGQGRTALILASCWGYVEVVEVLLWFRRTNIENLSQDDSSEEVNLISECGEALVRAVGGNEEVVETLLGVNGIDVNFVNKAGATALMQASRRGNSVGLRIETCQSRYCRVAPFAWRARAFYRYFQELYSQ
ncbi:ankyrin [Coprinopsis marcescibilis]|uniref:Ankyrin n=1 Tax=Coprinopsis marcescibilis TaxID=230819 RepID=A0A5C3KGS2_COPMA|nr:ankyrin [Coprinopsis marcescibilis]